MPPRGGPRGGGGGGPRGGGGHGHHHHHHRRPGGWHGGWGPGWYGPGYWGAQPAYAELVVPSCPDVVDPVLASDGRTYLNSCLANQAGATVVKHVGGTKMSGFEAPSPKTLVLLASAGALVYLFMRKPTGGRYRSASRVRGAIARRR